MKKLFFLLSIFICLISCKTKENCINDLKIKRFYDVPSPDQISFSTNLSEDYKFKISDEDFSLIIFYLNGEKIFETHDVTIYDELNKYDIVFNTTYFINNKNYSENEFYKLINSADSLQIVLVNNESNQNIIFSICN